MYGFKIFGQNVCTVNVHEMYYRFNPGPSPIRDLDQTHFFQF